MTMTSAHAVPATQHTGYSPQLQIYPLTTLTSTTETLIAFALTVMYCFYHPPLDL